MTLNDQLRELRNLPSNVRSIHRGVAADGAVQRPIQPAPEVPPPAPPPPEPIAVPAIVSQILSKHLRALLDATPETVLEKSENVLIVADQLKRSVALISSMMADSGRMYADAAEQGRRKREAEAATTDIDIRERLAQAVESLQTEAAMYDARFALAEKRHAALMKEAAIADRQAMHATDAASTRRRLASHLLALEAITAPEGLSQRPVLLFARAVFRHFESIEKTVEALVAMDSLSYVIPNDIVQLYLADLEERKLRESRDHEREMERLRLDLEREKRMKIEALATSV